MLTPMEIDNLCTKPGCQEPRRIVKGKKQPYCKVHHAEEMKLQRQKKTPVLLFRASPGWTVLLSDICIETNEAARTIVVRPNLKPEPVLLHFDQKAGTPT